jgi:hypothetical protein
MPGIPEDHVCLLFSECITQDASGSLTSLLPLAPENDVIQVRGLCVVGTPVGTAEYIREYVRSKCGTICKDVDTMCICSDPLIRYHLLKFCVNMRLSFLSCNVSPENMATSSDDRAHKGPVHVDQKIVEEVLSAATGDTAKNQNQHMLNWCKLSVQSPHHKGGYAITPTSASGLAAFYSATAKFVTLLASLPHGGAWVRGGQDLADHDTWSNSQLQALTNLQRQSHSGIQMRRMAIARS